MSTENDLILAIEETLESDGTLGKFKAKMRTKLMEILRNQDNNSKPKLSKELVILNELIREYLNWSGYQYAKSVFIQECGLDREPLSRSQLLEELGVIDSEESSK
ncbi:conserved hypothetical protein [Pediculus humanus corporis]|uniref:FGFR1 oncogene partner (FOP) N-terminal dimerisation domain-containing protein n=1 Tax=Pediculus humanus subsp. corporis TaxID=121224 RepID=E0VTA9_PEDHC|nr:uncharacterized protein Phum_PHUM429900 [Pediculus humanus corporis]EEB16615.1 conserved hypothetical protein [Pediculus humanus corporis]